MNPLLSLSYGLNCTTGRSGVFLCVFLTFLFYRIHLRTFSFVTGEEVQKSNSNPFVRLIIFLNPCREGELFSLYKHRIGQRAANRKMPYTKPWQRQKFPSSCVLLATKMLLCLQKDLNSKIVFNGTKVNHWNKKIFAAAFLVKLHTLSADSYSIALI